MRSSHCRMLLLRHGQSEWNVEGRWQGTADPPLTATGRKQAADGAAGLDEHGPFHAVWSSDLIRAADTADIVAESCGLPPAHRHPGLREAGFGPWQGLTIAEIEEQWPGYLGEQRRPPGAEDAELVLSRLTRALTDIARRTPKNQQLVVIAHAGVMRLLRRALQRPDMRYGNLGGYWVDVERKSGDIQVGASVSLSPAPVPESL